MFMACSTLYEMTISVVCSVEEHEEHEFIRLHI